MMRMNKIFAALLLLLLLTACGRRATVETTEYSAVPDPVVTAAPQSAAYSEYEPLRVYFNGVLSERGIIADGKAYMPLDALCELWDIKASVSFDGEKLSISAEGLELNAERNSPYVCANYRYYYSTDGFIVENGRAYLPPDVAGWIFGAKTACSLERVDVDTASLHLIEGWESYYDDCYTYEDVYWLSHIIYAEAMGEPFEGKVGVGNVVINRLRSELYPDTVFAVIHDQEHAIQFDPAVTGAMSLDPDAESIAAAYLALDGYSTVGDSMYFVNPEKGDPTWMKENKRFVLTIAHHDFYAEKES